MFDIKDTVIVREVVTRTVLEERNGEFFPIGSRIMMEREWVQPRYEALRVVQREEFKDYGYGYGTI